MWLSAYEGSNPFPGIKLNIYKSRILQGYMKTHEIKSRARRTLNKRVEKINKTYVADTSAIINRFIPSLIKRGLKGKLIVPNAVMAELENLANKGQEIGFTGLEEVARFHKFDSIKLFFQGIRPKEMHIRYAKSGEIDSLIRDIAFKNHAILITADLVQAKSAQAYGIEVIFLKPKPIKRKRRFLFWKK